MRSALLEGKERQRTEVRDQRTEDGRQRTAKTTGQKSEVGQGSLGWHGAGSKGGKIEVGSRRSEVGEGQRSEVSKRQRSGKDR